MEQSETASFHNRMYSSAHENEDPYEDQNDREYLIDLTGSASGIFAECTLHQKQEMTLFFAVAWRVFLGVLYLVGDTF